MSDSEGGPLHVADVFEAIGDAIPDADAIVHGPQRRTWREFEGAAAQLASALKGAGLAEGSRVGLYLHNSPAYLEGYLAAFKLRCVPININYRYVAEELLYLLENSGAEAIIFDAELSGRLASVAPRIPGLKLMVQVGAAELIDGAVAYESVIAGHPPMPRIARDGDDLAITYTGGTTGLPKGVMNRIGRQARGLMGIAAGVLGAGVPTDAAAAAAQAQRLRAERRAPVSIAAPPFMHGTGLSYGALVPLLCGGTVVIPSSRTMDPAELLTLAQDHGAAAMTIVGDVYSRPLLVEVDRARAAGTPYDISALRAIYSSGMIWTAESKRALLRHAPDATLIDVMGSTEGHIGTSIATRAHIPETGSFTPLPTTKVITSEGREVVPGSGERGQLACGGVSVSRAYFNDPAKTERTYRQIDGRHYVMAGDWATVELNGSVRLLGRSSSCINTGGEKVFAEEVEEVLLSDPAVADCIVVGVADPRWGEIVAAIVALAPGRPADRETIAVAARSRLASYKIPRRIEIVARVPRAPNGKPDLDRARRMILDAMQPADAA